MPKLFNFHRYDNFLDKQLNKEILNYCIEKKDQFLDSKVSYNTDKIEVDKKFRVALSYSNLGKYEEIIKKSILEKFNEFCEILKITPFEIESIEFGLAAHGNGAFFKPHIDTHVKHENQHKGRVISAVYYFFAEPKQFEGGELILYPFEFLPGNDEKTKLSPINNSLVIFPSFGLHEVSPVICPNLEFENWRFAINCWINK